MRAGFKRSRTRARVYSLYFRSLCGSIIDQSKSWRNFSSEKGEERRASFSKNLFFFPIDDRFGRKRKKMARDESCLAQGWIVLSHLPSPPPFFLGKPKRFLFHPPRIATTTLARERPLPLLPFIPFSPPPPPPPSGLSALSAPSPPRFFPSGYWTTFGRSEGAGRDL